VGYLRERPDLSQRKITVAFWTSGRFSPEAINYLDGKKAATLKYSIDWKDGQQVRDYARGNRLTGLIQVLENYYKGL
jgi:hypothetical protein